MEHDVPELQEIVIMSGATRAMQQAMKVPKIVATLSGTFVILFWHVWLDSINTSFHVLLYAPCVLAMLLYTIVH